MNFTFVFLSICIFVFNMSLMGCVATTDDMKGLYARQTRLEARVERIYQDVESLKKQSLAGSSSGEKQLAEIEASLADLEQSYSELTKRLNNLETRTTSSVPTPGHSVSSAVPGTSALQYEARVYEEAYKNLTEGNYIEARNQFKQFIASYPNSAQVADAQYWIAESYYREGKFEESILEFQRFIDSYPKDSRVPLSYLKQGLSLINIGRNEEAKLFLQTLIDKYPNSEEARIAREKLRELAVRR